jgi:hypothetical protein
MKTEAPKLALRAAWPHGGRGDWHVNSSTGRGRGGEMELLIALVMVVAVLAVLWIVLVWPELRA